MLLSNVTRLSEGALKLLQVGEALHGLRVAKLVELFTRKVDAKDTFAGIAGILCNITQVRNFSFFLFFFVFFFNCCSRFILTYIL